MQNWFDLAFAYAAGLGAVSALVWPIRKWWRESPDLQLVGGNIVEIVGEPIAATLYGLWKPSVIVFKLTLTNRSHEAETYVQGIAGTTSSGARFFLGDGFPLSSNPENLPCSLKPGESRTVELMVALVLESKELGDPELEVRELCAIDGRQRRWPLPKKDFRRLRAEASAFFESKRAEARAKELKLRVASGLDEVAAENEAKAQVEANAEAAWAKKPEKEDKS